MQTQFSASFLATEEGREADRILRKCVHCGFCNTTCPTYQLLGDELDGPRGRIYLVKELLETEQNIDVTKFHLDRCLTCKSCETTCPSGVEYSQLAEIARVVIAEHGPPKKLLEKLVLWITPKYQLFRKLVRLGRLFRTFAPRTFRPFLRNKPTRKTIRTSTSSSVVLLQGCVQRAMTPDVVDHLQKLLQSRGVAVSTVDNESCCGGLHLHSGERNRAHELMTECLQTLESNESKQYISSASGCGAVLKDYGRVLKTEEATEFANQVQDVSEYLSQFEFSRGSNYLKVALHIPCSLQHGLRTHKSIAPLLEGAGYVLVPTSNDHLCCGSAGTYSLFQSELAKDLLSRKVEDLSADSPDVIATANVGCQLHLAGGTKTPVVHWLSLLA